jgi:hypothetical protein
MKGMDMDDIDPQIRDALRAVRLSDARRQELAALAEPPPVRARWQPWVLGLAAAATLALVAVPLLPESVTEATGSGLLASPDLQMSDVDRVRSGPFEVLAVGDTVHSLGVFDAARGEDVLDDPAVRALPEGTILRLLGVRGERRTLFLDQRGWKEPGAMQRTFIAHPETNHAIEVAVMGNTDTVLLIEVDRQIALWIAEQELQGTRVQVQTEQIYDRRLVSFDVGPLDAWIPPESDVALIIDGEIATIGLLTAMTGKTASMWMPQDVAETLVERQDADPDALRLARIDPLEPKMATIATRGGSEKVTVPVGSLSEWLASRP